jgi:hypothetical protein
MKSKIEIRHEAAKLAVKLPGTTIENFHDRAYRLELYLTGEAVLPETLDEMDIINNVFDRIRSPQVVERASNLNF